MQLLSDLHNSGRTVLVVTHDPRMTRFATHKIFLLDGSFCQRSGVPICRAGICSSIVNPIASKRTGRTMKPGFPRFAALSLLFTWYWHCLSWTIHIQAHSARLHPPRSSMMLITPLLLRELVLPTQPRGLDTVRWLTSGYRARFTSSDKLLRLIHS